jgi:HlyD family secretion protein
VEQARARLKMAEESLAQARTRLGYAILTAPMDGVVLSENIEPGEYVAAGTPVVTIGRLDPLWLRVYIAESDLGRVKLGQAARVTTDTYPGRGYRGTVTFIAQDAEFTPKNVQTEQERVKLVYRVKITLPNPEHELKPGMPADAVIDLAGH